MTFSHLQNAVIKAVLDLFESSGAYAFKLPIPNTTPPLFITAGDFQNLDCPFCGLSGCDKIGLKRHFQNGHCDVFNDTPLEDEKACSFCGFRRKHCDDINCPNE